MTDQDDRPGGDAEAGQAETNRARVRRLLLDPLGFRFDKKTDPDEGRRVLDGLADDLAYMTDAGLAAMRDMLAGKGDGTQRCFWPPRATFIGFAEVVEPRPLADLPALRRWFGSVEGPKAQAEGTLVETFEFFERFKRPPLSDGARRMIADKAAENARRLRMVDGKLRQGFQPATEDVAWARWYRDRLASLADLVRVEREARGAA